MVDAERMHELLDAEGSDARALISSLTSDIKDLSAAREGDNSDDEHDPEGATLAFERSQADTLLHQSEERLIAIDEALQRLDQGTFGICTDCGKPIAEARLEVRPYAPTCVDCAR
ncbi:MAG: TraR/DksA C4-type zinc finger protein [Brevibacterium sp.]|uniref:TraR/DksA family transcriptional regulator n=1 Tax=Brevibacterium sp. TaxID=1701 RepID=UPI002647622A|nr:TraR/DksA C4-type zinc finger protein [Brevibacterium sp.]MDN5805924.1 TraR/DksA C4-type zinc finger protein [Brevibacterium sp.]MDN5833463.1 TraR/DksA C4-type zinc finger protein [Brevibacterium sp.]MDN5875456.1 TraR/DksA C4-type zinc finger protein [Brevibacterium sp.]MDN5908879.1 TraR/DksA C4-type zinc finger protein [Brevibacterium sp.]MDN6123178.1 TraR/DksA C4-type zinc finger protein [Brevibacterium sp.]